MIVIFHFHRLETSACASSMQCGAQCRRGRRWPRAHAATASCLLRSPSSCRTGRFRPVAPLSLSLFASLVIFTCILCLYFVGNGISIYPLLQQAGPPPCMPRRATCSVPEWPWLANGLSLTTSNNMIWIWYLTKFIQDRLHIEDS